MSLHLYPVRQNPAFPYLQKSKQNVHYGTLSRTGSPHDAHRGADGHRKLGMVEYELVRIGISVYNIPQLYGFPQGQLLFPLRRKGHVHAAVLDLVLQVIADPHEKRLEISDGIDLVVDAVHRGQQHEGGCGQHLQHVIRGGSHNRQRDHIPHHHGDTDRLDQKLGHIVV